MMSDTIKEGNHVVLMKSFDSGNIKIVPAVRDTLVHYGKLHFDPSPLIGAKYGAVFEINAEEMIEVKNFETYDEELSVMVTNKMATFNEKSQFSQEKLIKKKKKQSHSNIVTVIRPNIRLINEMLFARDKLGGLRIDVLSQIITLANVQNGTRCLLLDHNLGIVTGAVMSRCLPDGVCIQLVPDLEATCTTRKTLAMLNITEETFAGKLSAITIRDMYKISLGIDNFAYEDNIIRARAEEHRDRLSDNPTRTIRNEEENKITKVELDESERKELIGNLLKKDNNRESRNEERLKATHHLKSRSLDSIILVAQNDHPLPLLKLTYEFLAPSRQFVIYSDSVGPLLECHQYLKSQSLAISLNISESWLRHYQVLPDRTRPEMNTTGYGGYLLSGTKVVLGTKADAGISEEAMIYQ